jgi:hypothetical protein
MQSESVYISIYTWPVGVGAAVELVVTAVGAKDAQYVFVTQAVSPD